MWVVQELYFSDPSETIAVCGNKARTWDRLVLAQWGTGNIHMVSPRMPFGLYAGLGRSSYTLLEMQSSESSTLWNTLLRIARVRMAADPRDKIFTLLNLFDREEWPFAPDYLVNAVEVYTRVALYFMRKTNSLAIHTPHTLGHHTTPGTLATTALYLDHSLRPPLDLGQVETLHLASSCSPIPLRPP